MRKVVAGAMAVAALAWAGGARADHHTKAAQEKAEAQEKGREMKSEAKQEGREIRSEVKQEGREMRSEAQGVGRRGAEPKHPLFDGKENFDLDGKVQEASKDRITIQRDELPAATLKVVPGTKIEVDGQVSSANQLKRGQDVKASFNLRGGLAEAVEIKADKLEGEDRKEMGEQRRENQQDAAERAREQQQERK